MTRRLGKVYVERHISEQYVEYSTGTRHDDAVINGDTEPRRSHRPVLTETQRQILDYTESQHVTFDIDEMLAEAVQQAGSFDLADDDGFADRLAAHVAAIESDTGYAS